MSAELRFDGKVAIVTGAGGALGRAYALLLASRGAQVLVNDLGVPMAGSGSDSSPAQRVVDEIVAAGGKAVANYNNVLEGDKIVQAALDAFGRVDILINNAGILRDVTFAKMSDEQWKLIQDVHVNGAMRVTKAAWPHMLKQKYGRIIMTSSGAGLYGNVGQANYSAAKLSLVGFSNTLAKEGARNNVLCNTIAPVAGSRLTETVMPKEMVEALDPAYIAPIVAYLCHQKSTVNGCIFESGAGWVSQVRWQRSAGVHFPLTQFSPEAIAAQWEQIGTFDDQATYPSGLNDTMAAVLAQLGSNVHSDLGKGKPAVAARAQVSANAASGDAAGAVAAPAPKFESDAIFQQLGAAIRADPATFSQKVNAIFQYNLTRDGQSKSWTVNLKKQGAGTGPDQPRVYEGSPRDGRKADVVIDVSDADYCALAAGTASAQTLYLKSRFKLKGNLATAMKFDALIKAAQARAKL